MVNELFEAIDQHDLPRLAVLLAKGVDPNTPNPQHSSWPPLALAIDELTEGGSKRVRDATPQIWGERQRNRPITDSDSTPCCGPVSVG